MHKLIVVLAGAAWALLSAYMPVWLFSVLTGLALYAVVCVLTAGGASRSWLSTVLRDGGPGEER